MPRWSGYADERSPLRSPPQNVTNKDQNAEDHHQRVILHISGFNEAHGPAQSLHETADQADEAVHNPPVPPARSESAFHSAPRRTVDHAVHDLRIKLPQSPPRVL